MMIITALRSRVLARFKLPVSCACLAVILVVLSGVGQPPRAQSPFHLNPVVDKLSRGEPFFGVNTGDLSFDNAHVLTRAPIDFVYVDMEHHPLNIEALHLFLLGMIDKAAIHQKGNLRPNVAAFARFPTAADESEWIVKQALDIGLMGIIFNGVENREQALAAIQSMRYPQRRGSPYREPVGKRGHGPSYAEWIWGISGDELTRHSDLWPLNPEGDLLAILMIESVEAIDNLDEILSVPGVGAAFIGQGGDLTFSLGVAAGAPEVEDARQRILKGCLAHKVACGISVNSANDVVRRIREGWKMIRGSVDTIRNGRAAPEARKQ
jgi:4-hydroxy-2-oxoheptanedioate aldolase